MNFDVTKFGLYTAGTGSNKKVSESKEKKVEKKDVETPKVEVRQCEADSLEAMSLQNIAGMKLAGKVDEQTQNDLAQMFAMAGISQKFMPTADVYSRIASSTVNAGRIFDDVKTENNVRNLFASDAFKRLNDEFGIV